MQNSLFDRTYRTIDFLYKAIVVLGVAYGGFIAVGVTIDIQTILPDELKSRYQSLQSFSSSYIGDPGFMQYVATLLALLLFALFLRYLRSERRIFIILSHFAGLSSYLSEQIHKMLGGVDAHGHVEDRAMKADFYAAFLTVVATRLAEIVKASAGCSCYVNIKAFSSNDGLIKTFGRSTNSVVQRHSSNDRETPVSYLNNYPFKEIIENPSCSYFVAKNLRSQEIKGKYFNKSNPDWKSFYNSCIVVPITRSERAGDINRNSILGFLCIDSKSALPEKGTTLLLSQIISRQLSVFMVEISKQPRERKLK